VRVGVELSGGVEVGRVFDALGVALEGSRVKADLQTQLKTYVMVIVIISVIISAAAAEEAMAVEALLRL
jgi:hypothetical protein